MGFVDKVFTENFKRVTEWSKEIKNKVVAVDTRGRFSHPFRWGIDHNLYNKAVSELVKVLERN